MEKINVAELLSNCPKGMELDCTMFDDVKLDYIKEDTDFPIKCFIGKENSPVSFNMYGEFNIHNKAKCVIFPKGKTTWEGFHRPFKDGDIVYIRDEYSDTTFTYVAILKQIEKGEQVYAHCFYNYEDDIFSTHDYLYDGYNIRFATEEEKQKLFDSIKANGYKWNPETKTLEKINPKFKIGNRVKKHKDHISGIVTNISDDGEYKVEYQGGGVSYINIAYQDEWELDPSKFDINTLKPFDKVLVRDNNGQQWTADMFSFYSEGCVYPCRCVAHDVNQCIPYDQNKHLLGTTDDCDEYFKTWK